MIMRRLPSRYFRLCLLTTLCICIASGALGFAPPISKVPRAVAAQQSITALPTSKDSNYNDDAFGFIFLGGSAAAQDPLFGATFFTLSVTALIATKLDALPANKQVPAAVAGFTLLTVPVLSNILPETMFDVSMVPGDNARLIELAFCTVSLLYGFVFSASKQNE